MAPDPLRGALLVLGCPQVPVQTAIALYLVSRLRKLGIVPVIAGNRAARMLVEVSDPDRHYTGEVIDLDRCVGEIADGTRDFRLCFVFIHNDAGITYGATVQAISKASMIAVVFGEHHDEVLSSIPFPCEMIEAGVDHNPAPLRQKIDAVLPWITKNL
ncbi:MAG: DUF1890 domain-containing protein [Methanoregulaceae archaeon]|nr:DUF1890 domain-containing protein [Methanoregulaceae archaeon]